MPGLVKRGLPVLLTLVFVTLCVTSLVRKSGTYDEYYVGLGTRLSSPESLFHPPLSFAMHSLPFLWLEIPEEIWREPHGQLRGQQVVALRSDDWMLDSARIALLPMGVLAIWVVFFWGRRLYGFWGGALAMALVALDPNLIAHARLITPDVTLAACALLALYRLWRLADEPGRSRRITAGLAFGLMLLAKYTALLLAPIFLAADLAYRCARGRPDLRRLAGDWGSVLGLGALLLWAGYGFDAGWLALGPDLALPVPAPRYFEGALFQWSQSRLPHDFFLMGQHSKEGWWYFYAVVLLVKTPLGTLLLLTAMLLGGRALGFRWRAEEVYLWLPPLLLLAYLSFFNTLHNGFRYLLPVFPLLVVLLGRYAQLAARSLAFGFALAVPVAWVAFASFWIWPDYLAYANELIGGPRNAYLALSDSNLDWGQDLEQLAEYMERNEIPRVQLAYFGTADPAHYGIDYVYLPSPNSPLRPSAEGEDPPRIVALSAYQYQGVAFPDKDHYGFFHGFVPNAQIGYSILVYDLDRLIERR